MPNNIMEETREVSNLQQPIPQVVSTLPNLQLATNQFCDGLLQTANILAEKASKIRDLNLKTSFLSVADNIREISSTLLSFFDNSSRTANCIESVLGEEDNLDERLNGMVREIRDLSKQLGVVVATVRLVSDSIRQISDAIQEDDLMTEAGLEFDEVLGEAAYDEEIRK